MSQNPNWLFSYSNFEKESPNSVTSSHRVSPKCHRAVVSRHRGVVAAIASPPAGCAKEARRLDPYRATGHDLHTAVLHALHAVCPTAEAPASVVLATLRVVLTLCDSEKKENLSNPRVEPFILFWHRRISAEHMFADIT